MKSVSKPSALILISLVLAACMSAQSVFAAWTLTSNGQLVYQSEGQVLGVKDNPGLGDQMKAANANNPTQSDDNLETSDEDGDKKTPPGLEKKLDDSEDSDNSTPRTVRLKPIPQEKIKVKLLNKFGEEISVPEGTESGEFDIEPPEYQQNIKVRTKNQAAYVIKNKIAAQSHFPLTVNLETNELIVTTPKGAKVVTVLPDKAVENMLAANVLDQLGGKGGLRWLQQQATPSATPYDDATSSATPDDDATQSGNLDDEDDDQDVGTSSAAPQMQVETEADQVVELTTDDQSDTLVYRIQGSKFKKLFGFRDVELPRTAVVSAETGELIRVEQTLYHRILDFLSTN
jgi:hypothetical protein